MQSISLPISQATTNSLGGGSLRMKLLNRNNDKNSQICLTKVLGQDLNVIIFYFY